MKCYQCPNEVPDDRPNIYLAEFKTSTGEFGPAMEFCDRDCLAAWAIADQIDRAVAAGRIGTPFRRKRRWYEDDLPIG